VITIDESEITPPTLKAASPSATDEPTQEKTHITTPKEEPPAAEPTPVEPEPTEEATKPSVENSMEKEPVAERTFERLTQKIYDRDYDLGTCFERNIHFKSYQDGSLSWESSAQGDDKKMLITHWAVIKMFVQELFGIETKIVNIPREREEANGEQKKKLDSPTIERDRERCEEESGSMIEKVEMKGSCIMPEAGETEAAKEKEPSNILEEPMIKEILERFEPKKVRVRRKV
jgi:DNA polymerase-3 subunit gamma/tau